MKEGSFVLSGYTIERPLSRWLCTTWLAKDVMNSMFGRTTRVVIRAYPLGASDDSARAALEEGIRAGVPSGVAAWQKIGKDESYLLLCRGYYAQTFAERFPPSANEAPRPEMLACLATVAHGIDDLIRGWPVDPRVHVSPSNLLVGENDRAVIADYGVSLLAQAVLRVDPGPYVPPTDPYRFMPGTAGPDERPGTPRGRAQFDLAAAYFHLRTGRPLFYDKTLPPFRAMVEATRAYLGGGDLDLAGLSDGAERDVVRRALSRDPSARFPSCAAFIQGLVALASHPRASMAAPAQGVFGPRQAPAPATTEALVAALESMPRPPDGMASRWDRQGEYKKILRDLAAVGDRGALPAVIAAVPFVEESGGMYFDVAAEVLAKLSARLGAEATPALLEALDSAPENLRPAFVRALVRTGDPRALDTVAAVLGPKGAVNTPDRRAILGALEEVGGAGAVRPLVELAGQGPAVALAAVDDALTSVLERCAADVAGDVLSSIQSLGARESKEPSGTRIRMQMVTFDRPRKLARAELSDRAEHQPHSGEDDRRTVVRRLGEIAQLESLGPETRLSEVAVGLHRLAYFLSQAQKAFGVALPWTELTRINTFGELADLIVKARDKPSDPFRNG